jgi:exodeoxyribonuclease V alpha subunit
VSEKLPELLALLFPFNVQPQPNWQKVACAMATRSQFTIITGGPGTGKTFTVVRLLALLQALAETQQKRLNIALAAPTGKAAARLGESIANALSSLPEILRQDIPTNAVTLHRLLGLSGATRGFKTISADVVVVDEASMVDLERMAQLMQAIPATSTIILLGDKDQLASVEAGAVLGQLCAGADAGGYTDDVVEWLRVVAKEDVSAFAGAGHALAQQTVMLRHSRRFEGDSGIGLWAQAVNAGDVDAVQQLYIQALQPSQEVQVMLIPRLQQLERLKQLVLNAWSDVLNTIRVGQDHSQTTDAWALSILSSLSQFQVLCGARQGMWGVIALNNMICKWLSLDSQYDWFAGRPIMVTRNNYTLNLMNGDVGICLWHPDKQALRVAFITADRGVRWVLPSRLTEVETAFAMTVHKSQGSEFDHTLLVLSGQDDDETHQGASHLTKELLYTGITRAKKKLTLAITSEALLLNAVKTRVHRLGGLTFA